jgi:hypothetical protein
MPHQCLLGELVVQVMTAFIRLILEDLEDLECDLYLLSGGIDVHPTIDIRESTMLHGMFIQQHNPVDCDLVGKEPQIVGQTIEQSVCTP